MRFRWPKLPNTVFRDLSQSIDSSWQVEEDLKPTILPKQLVDSEPASCYRRPS